MLDGDTETISVSNSCIHDPKASFAKYWANFVEFLKWFSWWTEHFQLQFITWNREKKFIIQQQFFTAAVYVILACQPPADMLQKL